MKCTKTIALSISAAVALFAAPLMGETTEVAQKVESNAVQATEEGELVGNVFAEKDGEATPVEAKLTLSADGVVVDSTVASEDGSFSFPNVEPGAYQLYGASDGYVGGQSYDVQPYSTSGGCSSCSLGLQSQPSEVVYNAPASACSSCAAPASPCGCGGGLGGGGGFGGGGGGGLLGGGGGGFNARRLLALGAVGGIIAVAVADDDDDDDASPDN